MKTVFYVLLTSLYCYSCNAQKVAISKESFDGLVNLRRDTIYFKAIRYPIINEQLQEAIEKFTLNLQKLPVYDKRLLPMTRIEIECVRDTMFLGIIADNCYTCYDTELLHHFDKEVLELIGFYESGYKVTLYKGKYYFISDLGCHNLDTLRSVHVRDLLFSKERLPDSILTYRFYRKNPDRVAESWTVWEYSEIYRVVGDKLVFERKEFRDKPLVNIR